MDRRTVPAGPEGHREGVSELFSDWREWAERAGEVRGRSGGSAELVATRKFDKCRLTGGARAGGIGLRPPSDTYRSGYPIETTDMRSVTDLTGLVINPSRVRVHTIEEQPSNLSHPSLAPAMEQLMNTTILALDLGTHRMGAAAPGRHDHQRHRAIQAAALRGAVACASFDSSAGSLNCCHGLRPHQRGVLRGVRRHAGVDAAHAYGGFMGHLTAWCEHHNIPYQGVSGRHDQTRPAKAMPAGTT